MIGSMPLTNQPKPGAALTAAGADFSIYSREADRIELCLFADNGHHELCRLNMEKGRLNLWHASVENIRPGQRYGYRAYGPYEPQNGFWFDPEKLLVDPYATEIDRPFTYSPTLSVFGMDTTLIVPKAIVTHHQPVDPAPPKFRPGELIYEINIRSFTLSHPEIPARERGTLRALTHPSVIRHLTRLGVSAVELMPVTAWIDERHLAPLRLANSWGYNPVAMMALDPRLAPGGVRDLHDTVAVLHAHGIAVILDLVFNHTGESDIHGPTLSMRGLDNLAYYRTVPIHPAILVNDTGCGNTLACDHAPVRDLIIETLHHFVRHTGVDGFRFDLAPIMGRSAHGFSPDAALFKAILADPILRDRILIAEPWDVGPGGYQLGHFPEAFLEWNDRARDDVRMFWRGDRSKIGDLATMLAGSSGIFKRNGNEQTRTVNFIAAHDGFTLADLVSYEKKHNEANGEENRDGHNENLSWNNGVEGETIDPAIRARRNADIKALLATLFVSRGTIMLTAGDELGRTQKGNNNAYAQDNALTWIDWASADADLLAYTEKLAEIRNRFSVFSALTFLNGNGDVAWLNAKGEPKNIHEWEDPGNGLLIMVLKSDDRETGERCRLAIAFNRDHETRLIHVPGGTKAWKALIGGGLHLPARSVSIFLGDADELT
jgi:glycogen operon protein